MCFTTKQQELLKKKLSRKQNDLCKSCLANGGGQRDPLKKRKKRGTDMLQKIRFASSLWLLTEHLSHGSSFLNLLGFA